MTEKINKIGMFSTAASGGIQSVSSGLAILVALLLPVDVNTKVVAAGALSPLFNYILPSKAPWKK